MSEITLRSTIGSSLQGRDIRIQQLTQGSCNVLLIAGVHGDEVEGFQLIEHFIDQGGWAVFAGILGLWVIPRLNPDGCDSRRRWNHRGVDLNRNMPTQNWTEQRLAPRYSPGPAAGSEPETQALITCLNTLKPIGILSAHSSYTDLCVNYNGPAKGWAQIMSDHNGLRLLADIGYPTPGSLGNWAGTERHIPTITLEIERACSSSQVWQDHAPGLMAGLHYLASSLA